VKFQVASLWFVQTSFELSEYFNLLFFLAVQLTVTSWLDVVIPLSGLVIIMSDATQVAVDAQFQTVTSVDHSKFSFSKSRTTTFIFHSFVKESHFENVLAHKSAGTNWYPSEYGTVALVSVSDEI